MNFAVKKEIIKQETSSKYAVDITNFGKVYHSDYSSKSPNIGFERELANT